MSHVGHAIVACARSWLGTRFHHQGRLKKTALHAGGVDCLGLLIGIAVELDLRDANGFPLSASDERNYPHYPDTEHLRQRLSQLMLPVEPKSIGVGDVALLRIDDHPQHLAILCDRGEGLGLIHAYAPARAVVEHAMDSYWRQRIEAAFRIT